MNTVIRQLRQKVGISVDQLAREAGINVSLMTKYDRGDVRSPSLVVSYKLVRALAPRLGMSEAELLVEIAREFECHDIARRSR